MNETVSIDNKSTTLTVENSPHYHIRKESFFLDELTHQHFRTHGWCVVKNVVTSDEIKAFQNTYNYITGIDGFSIDCQFLNTGCLPNSEIREKTSDVINTNVKTILPRMFKMDVVAQHTGGSFVIKPPHEESGLAPHQDSSFIDEEKDYSLFMWVPFCDVNEKNGAISVLSGSHLWGNTQRGFSAPWNLQKHADLMAKYMHPVYIHAGDVLIFDPALVHSSEPNFSEDTRHAITITVVRANPELIYYYRDSATPPGIIEKFFVDEEFFRTYDFASKPDENKWRKETIPYKPFDISEEELLALIEQYTPSH